MSLKKLIVAEINKSGPITISRFMEHCLYNKKFGYYSSKKNAIGGSGDFVTSPEISQVFGELIGIWLAQTWIDRGKPTPFSLVELGPGNGTLMLDILNVMKRIPSFSNAVTIVLVETSQTLQVRQKNLLKSYTPIWVEDVSNIPEQPFFLIANEFLDALPIRQFKKANDVWCERSIALTNNGDLQFVYVPSNFNRELNVLYRDIPNDVVVETSDITKSILSHLSEKLIRNGGVCLFVDYGHFDGVGETLQAVFQHSYADPLTNLGKNDLTAQVNFKNVYNLVKRKGLRASNLKTQRTFLTGLGINKRSEILAKKMPKSQKENHFKAVSRLIDENQMGNLFKVIGITTSESPNLPLLEQ